METLSDSLGEWYVASVIDTFDVEERKKRINEEKLSSQSDHERLIGALTADGIDTQQPIVDIIHMTTRSSDALLVQLRHQWDQYVEHVHRVNRASIERAMVDQPNYFRDFCNSVTFANCFSNPLWSACSPPGVADTSATLYPVLSTKKPLRPKRALETIRITRAPKSADIMTFVRLMVERAKARAKHDELKVWHTEKLTPVITRVVELAEKTRSANIVKDDSVDAAANLTKLCDKSRTEWKEAFEGGDAKETGDALKQLQQESSALEMKNVKLLMHTPATLEYLSQVLNYRVASAIEGSVTDTAALVHTALEDLKAIESVAEQKICLDQNGVVNRGPKRARKEERSDPEQKDVRGAVAWLTKLDKELHDRLQQLREAMPDPQAFESARDQAFACAVYVDYAIWVQDVLKLVNPQATVLDAMVAIQPKTTHIDWLKKQELQVDERVAKEVDTQRRNAAAVVDSVNTRLKDLNKWYLDLSEQLRNIQADADRDLLAIPKPWNEKPLSELHRNDLMGVFFAWGMQPESKAGPNATQVVAGMHRLQAFVAEKRPVKATNYRTLQIDVEYWLLGAVGLWLYDQPDVTMLVD